MISVNYQNFVNTVSMPCCVLSVEKKGDSYGEIRIVCFNEAYKASMGPGCRENMLYYDLVPQDNKFEDYCFRAAILHQRMHAYVEVKALNGWIDQTMIPLQSDCENLGYCQFIYEFTQDAEADRMASVSVDVAETVIEACIRMMGSRDFRSGVDEVMRLILDTAGAEASRVMLVDHNNRKAVCFCQQCCEELVSSREIDDDAISYDLILTWESMLGVSNAIIIKDTHDMQDIEKRNPAWALSLRQNGIRTLVLLPLRRDGTVIGYLYVVNFDVTKTVEIKESLELISFFLGSEISNHLLLRRLEEISQIDVLTGINNRRAMIQRVHRMNSESCKSPYGVVNIDLNGLKVVNDQEGHEAGDRLLVQASEILKKVYYQDDLYRTGGDEFIVITENINQETFERKLERLRSDAEKNSKVSFAIGEFWSDGSDDLTAAFRCADERMYADKNAYYDRHSELRRR